MSVVGRGFEVDQGANDLSDGFVGTFDDAVGGGRVRRDVDGFDSCVIDGELKVVTMEFGTIVVDDSSGARVAREPTIFEELTDLIGCLGTGNANNFNEVSDGINACESFETEINAIDFDCPGTDAVDVNFGPRENGSCAGSKLTGGFIGCANLRADEAVGNDVATDEAKIAVIEVATEKSF